MAKGGVDILIGTHRLLQKDVQFRDLGLVVVDEEHRFGVRHKERLKQLRTEQKSGVATDTRVLSRVPDGGGRAAAVSLPRDIRVRGEDVLEEGGYRRALLRGAGLPAAVAGAVPFELR